MCLGLGTGRDRRAASVGEAAQAIFREPIAREGMSARGPSRLISAGGEPT